jgi:hypothetical protein
MYLVGMLVLLFLANLAMLMGMTNWPARVREGFAQKLMRSGVVPGGMMGMEGFAAHQKMRSGVAQGGLMGMEGFADLRRDGSGGHAGEEKFMDYLSNGFATAPIGSYDGVNIAAAWPAASQGFRYKNPNVPLAGPPVEVGPDNLFIFKNNECKPECCGSTLSCDGGCVCTTPEQRDFINTRGGNRVHGGDF